MKELEEYNPFSIFQTQCEIPFWRVAILPFAKDKQGILLGENCKPWTNLYVEIFTDLPNEFYQLSPEKVRITERLRKIVTSREFKFTSKRLGEWHWEKDLRFDLLLKPGVYKAVDLQTPSISTNGFFAPWQGIVYGFGISWYQER